LQSYHQDDISGAQPHTPHRRMLAQDLSLTEPPHPSGNTVKALAVVAVVAVVVLVALAPERRRLQTLLLRLLAEVVS
jgi:hypothetical protein